MHVFFSTPCFEFMLCLLIILLLFLYWYIFCDLHACYFILLFCCITVIFSAVLAFYMIIRLALYLVLLVHKISVIILIGWLVCKCYYVG